MRDRRAGRAQQVGDSLWIARRVRAPRAPLETDLAVDVAIVGAGIVGASAAMLLAAEGRTVALLEARDVGSGNTGLSTAKASLFHGTTFASLVDEVGVDAATDIVMGERAALDVMSKWAAELGVADAARPVTHWAYASTPDGFDTLDKEHAAAAAIGIETRWADPGESPFGDRALGVAEQLNIDPVVLLDAFVDRAARHDAHVHEHTRVTGFDLGDVNVLTTETGRSIRANHVIVATQLPILDRSAVFAGAEYRRSHVVALEHADAFGFAPDMYTGVDPGALSVRPALDTDGTPMVVVAGQGHALDEDEDGSHVEQLERAARDLTGAGELRRAWLAHDVFPSDGHPFIGPIHGHDNVHVATGFAGWGLAAGVSASLAITGLILRGHARWHEAMSATRLGPYEEPSAIRQGVKTAVEFVTDRISHDDEVDIASLAPGTGLVARLEGRMVAIARADDGALHGVDATCTHMGCTVSHEPEAHCWQCPCHGSRFALDGTVLQGPAIQALERIDVNELDLPGAEQVE